MSRLLASQDQEFTRMTRSSRLMPVTRGRSPTWGNDRMAYLGVRHGSVQNQENSVAVEGIRRRRQERVASMPDQRHVDEIREEERARGGPSAPHNSLDLSVINLSETVAIIDDEEPEVFYNRPILTPPNDDFSEDGIVPPLDPTEATAMLDSALAQRSSLNTTIDLTDSPVRPSTPLIPRPSTPSQGSPPTQYTNLSPSSSSSLKCPVCLETFSSIRKRGNTQISSLNINLLYLSHRFSARLHLVWSRVLWQVPPCVCPYQWTLPHLQEEHWLSGLPPPLLVLSDS